MQNDESLVILKEIQSLQEQQVASMNAMLLAQQEYLTLYKSHLERVEAINNQAERIQSKSESMMDVWKRGVGFVFMIVILLVAYLSWILFFR